MARKNQKGDREDAGLEEGAERVRRPAFHWARINYTKPRRCATRVRENEREIGYPDYSFSLGYYCSSPCCPLLVLRFAGWLLWHERDTTARDAGASESDGLEEAG